MSDFEDAMDDMWELLKQKATPEELEKLKSDHSCIDEIDEFGPNGPCGIGLGNFGGHAVG
jgi:hypothetical protein